MTKTYYIKERLVAARPRSKRLRMLGGTVSSNVSYVSNTSSDGQANAPAGRSGMPSSVSSVSRFSTARDDSAPVEGQCYFDQNLGLPLWWNGTNWVNAMGARLLSCVIDGVESSLLEGSPLVVEIPDGATATVLMGGNNITDEVLDDRVVTISHVADDIEIMYSVL